MRLAQPEYVGQTGALRPPASASASSAPPCAAVLAATGTSGRHRRRCRPATGRSAATRPAQTGQAAGDDDLARRRARYANAPTALAAPSSSAAQPSACAGDPHSDASELASPPLGFSAPPVNSVRLRSAGASRYASSPSSAPAARTPSGPEEPPSPSTIWPVGRRQRGAERAAELEQHQRRLAAARSPAGALTGRRSRTPRRRPCRRSRDRSGCTCGARAPTAGGSRRDRTRPAGRCAPAPAAASACRRARPGCARSSGRTSTICGQLAARRHRPRRRAARHSRSGRRSGRTARCASQRVEQRRADRRLSERGLEHRSSTGSPSCSTHRSNETVPGSMPATRGISFGA